MDFALEEKVKVCSQCQSNLKMPAAAPLHPWPSVVKTPPGFCWPIYGSNVFSASGRALQMARGTDHVKYYCTYYYRHTEKNFRDPWAARHNCDRQRAHFHQRGFQGVYGSKWGSPHLHCPLSPRLQQLGRVGSGDSQRWAAEDVRTISGNQARTLPVSIQDYPTHNYGSVSSGDVARGGDPVPLFVILFFPRP